MTLKQLKNLPKYDPLFSYLCTEILPKTCPVRIEKPEFAVYCLHSKTHNNKVYLYEEIHTKCKFVGKFFISSRNESSKIGERAEREFHNLVYLQNCNLQCPPHSVIKPIAYNKDLNHLLLLEYAEGTSFCKIIRDAISNDKVDTLFEKLSSLAFFLATLHNQTVTNLSVDFNKEAIYFYHILDQLKISKGLSSHDLHTLTHLCEEWRDQDYMWQDRKVLVHGDATPPNFIFTKEGRIVAIDLERMKPADRIFDLGRIIGELQHYFIHMGKHKQEAEPLVGHFLWEYCKYFPNQVEAFHSITKRLPFQIALTFLRIARNDWIDYSHAERLLQEAKQTLQGVSHAN